MDTNNNTNTNPLGGITYLWLCQKARAARALGLADTAQSLRDRADWMLARRAG